VGAIGTVTSTSISYALIVVKQNRKKHTTAQYNTTEQKKKKKLTRVDVQSSSPVQHDSNFATLHLVGFKPHCRSRASVATIAPTMPRQ
jgi:hypothetical protein